MCMSCHVRNPTPIIFWARGNKGIEQQLSIFLVCKETEQCAIKTANNLVVRPSASDLTE